MQIQMIVVTLNKVQMKIALYMSAVIQTGATMMPDAKWWKRRPLFTVANWPAQVCLATAATCQVVVGWGVIEIPAMASDVTTHVGVTHGTPLLATHFRIPRSPEK